MKKYLKLLFVAVFATMTFAFTACGDDDDEPDGGSNNKGVVGELTINGTKTSFYYIVGDNEPDIHKFDYDAELFRKDFEVLSIQIYEDIMTFKKGEDLSGRVTVVTTFVSGFLGGNNLESGSITLTDIDSKYITLTFDNAVVKDYQGIETLSIDGTVKLPIDGEMGNIYELI